MSVLAIRLLAPFLALALFTPRASAQSEARVLVLPTGGEVRPSLLEVLRIQLIGVATVEVGAPPSATGLAADLEHASAELTRADAALAVWVEMLEAAPDRAVLYVVGRQQDLALVRVARITGPSASELDRALALTIAELLDSVLALQRAEAEAPAVVQRLARAPDDPPAPAPPAPIAPSDPIAPPLATLGAAVELGGAILVGTGTSTVAGAGRVALAVWHALGGAWLEAGLSAALPSAVGASVDGASVEVVEVGVAATLRILARLEPWLALGGALDLGVRAIEARGHGADGRAGAASTALPAATLALDARFTILPGLAIRGAIGLEVGVVDQRYTVASAQVFALGLARPIFALGLVASTM